MNVTEVPHSREWRARSLGLAAFALFLAATRPCAAQASDHAMAEQLFRTGQELMRAERYAEACPKLAESQRMDPSTGTLLNLAVCHEKQGKLASAWTEYNDVATLARRDQRPDRVQYAEQRLAALEPKLARLTIELSAGGDAPGLEIRLDGNTLGRPALGVAAPIDPGSHVVSASAAGKRPWEAKVEIAEGALQTKILVPKLEDAPAEAPPGAPAESLGAAPAAGFDAPPATGKTQRISAFAVGGLGVVAVGVGSFFGLRAISKNGDSNDQGCVENQCPPDAAATRRSAATAGNISTIAFIVGGVALAGGVVLYVTAPRARTAPRALGEPKPRAASASLTFGPSAASVALGTEW